MYTFSSWEAEQKNFLFEGRSGYIVRLSQTNTPKQANKQTKPRFPSHTLRSQLSG